ncbi:protein of unknown function [Agreia sp. COWG]|nr:protein of unknown function [Agreia sp. COWG]
MSGRLAQLVARFVHTEEVIGSSPVSPTHEKPRSAHTQTGAFLVSSHRASRRRCRRLLVD